MKNKHSFGIGASLAVLLLMVVSCEKVNWDETASESSPANVTLRVGSFEQVPFATSRATDVTTLCSRINFAVYDSTGTRIWKADQKAGDADFGQVRMTLAEGRYFLMAVAHSCSGNPSTTKAYKIQFTNATGYTDTFYYGDSLLVGDSPVERLLTLRRNVAKVRFEYTDVPPANATRIRFEYKGGSGAFDAATGWGVVASQQYQWYDIDRSRNYYEIYTIPHEDGRTLKVDINSYQIDDAVQVELSTKHVEDIPVSPNQVTICRGNLFDGEAATSRNATFSLVVDDEWQAGETVDF